VQGNVLSTKKRKKTGTVEEAARAKAKQSFIRALNMLYSCKYLGFRETSNFALLPLKDLVAIARVAGPMGSRRGRQDVVG